MVEDGAFSHKIDNVFCFFFRFKILKQSETNILIFKFILEYSLQIIFIFVFALKKITNDIHIRICSRL